MSVTLLHGRSPGGAALPPLLLDEGRLHLLDDDTIPRSGEVVDLDGRTVIPGLWDQHVHFSQWAMYARRLDLGHTTSAAQVAAECRTAIAARPACEAGEPLLAFGIRPQLWADEPTAAVLDEGMAHVPVVVACMDLHSAWANSAAIAHYGMEGHQPGLLREEPCFELMRRMGDVPPATVDAWVADAARKAAARGLVGIVDMEMTWNRDPWRRRMAAGFDALRVRASIYPQWLDQALGLGLRTGDVDAEHPLLEIGPLKCITDGSLNTRTAYCYDEYPRLPGDPDDCPAHHGVMTFSQEQIHDLLTGATAGGITCAIHAIGDAANAICLDEFEATGARGRIEHAQLLVLSDAERFARLGVAASVQPQHLLDDRESLGVIWPGRGDRSYAFRSLLDAGVELLLGTDAPVAALDPWHQIQAGVERALPGDVPFHPEQRLTPAEALAASTDGHGCEVVDGMVADLAVLDADPFVATGAELREMPVAATLLAGRFTHREL